MRAALFLGLLAGCSGATDDARAAFLRTTILDDNRPWLDREPDLVAQKLQKMATRTYDYLRGTAGQYWRDVTEVGGPVDASTTFGDGPSSLVWLVGDPHLENVGTFRGRDDVMRVDWNDLDAAAAGPWWDDLRRLAVSWRIAVDDEPMMDGDALVRAAVAGYADEIAALAAGEPGTKLREDAGAVLGDLVERALEDGDTGERLDEYTVLEDGVREMRYGDISPRRADGVYVDTVTRIDGVERLRVEAAIAAWQGTARLGPDDDEVEILATGRRYGAGVASYPLLRYYVLLAGPTAASDDDWLVELRECGDGLRIVALPRFPDVGSPSNGERIVASQRALGEDGYNDVLLGWGDVAPLSYKVHERTGYQKGIDVARLLEDFTAGDFTEEDLLALAGQLGHLLGRSHGDAPTAAGPRGADVIAPRIAGREDALADETTAFAAAYAAVVRADAALLADLLAAEGPLLGAPR